MLFEQTPIISVFYGAATITRRSRRRAARASSNTGSGSQMTLQQDRRTRSSPGATHLPPTARRSRGLGRLGARRLPALDRGGLAASFFGRSFLAMADFIALGFCVSLGAVA